MTRRELAGLTERQRKYRHKLRIEQLAKQAANWKRRAKYRSRRRRWYEFSADKKTLARYQSGIRIESE